MNYKELNEKHLLTCRPSEDNVEFVKAYGCTYEDPDGRKFLNLNEISCVLGYGHPKFNERVSQAVLSQMIAHGGNVSKKKGELIWNFLEVTRGELPKMFFAASGGEVVDWSIKLARRVTGKDGIISFHKALHGRSFAGAYISGTPTRKEGFGSGLSNVYFWDYPADGEALEKAAGQYEDIAAIIIEPHQAIGGMVSPSKEYWKWLREYTRANNILLIVDEIQTGFGKTGSFFAYEKTGIIPDILLAGKGLSNGFGMGALLTTEEVAGHIKFFEMSGGSADNDLMCTIANTVFDIMREEKLLEHVQNMGKILRMELASIASAEGRNWRVDGDGLFMSIEVPQELAEKAVISAKIEGVLFGRAGNRIMIRPALVLTEEELRYALSVLKKSLLF